MVGLGGGLAFVLAGPGLGPGLFLGPGLRLVSTSTEAGEEALDTLSLRSESLDLRTLRGADALGSSIDDPLDFLALVLAEAGISFSRADLACSWSESSVEESSWRGFLEVLLTIFLSESVRRLFWGVLLTPIFKFVGAADAAL